ncbi:hypothetical protein SNEBB_006328 [Seison nebaliae]|nr:hypothetical protein SNEBB_006328 [Seison nebaliae]
MNEMVSELLRVNVADQLTFVNIILFIHELLICLSIRYELKGKSEKNIFSKFVSSLIRSYTGKFCGLLIINEPPLKILDDGRYFYLFLSAWMIVFVIPFNISFLTSLPFVRHFLLCGDEFYRIRAISIGIANSQAHLSPNSFIQMFVCGVMNGCSTWLSIPLSRSFLHLSNDNDEIFFPFLSLSLAIMGTVILIISSFIPSQIDKYTYGTLTITFILLRMIASFWYQQRRKIMEEEKSKKKTE